MGLSKREFAVLLAQRRPKRLKLPTWLMKRKRSIFQVNEVLRDGCDAKRCSHPFVCDHACIFVYRLFIYGAIHQ